VIGRSLPPVTHAAESARRFLAPFAFRNPEQFTQPTHPTQSVQRTHPTQATHRVQPIHARHATHSRTATHSAVNALAITATLPAVRAEPATATLPAVATEPATATLPAVEADPATAALPAVATEPATATLSTVAIEPTTVSLSTSPAESHATAMASSSQLRDRNEDRADYMRPTHDAASARPHTLNVVTSGVLDASAGQNTARPRGERVTITYNEALRKQILGHLANHDRRTVTDPTKRHAAVAVVLVDSEVGEDRVDPAPVDDWNDGRPMPGPGLDGRMVDVSGGAAFLLCRRASRLTSHAAQWALPGGRVDPGETVVDAALRELDEEVGIRLSDSTVLGLLDDYSTRSGYVITPVVIWGGGRLDPHPAPDEVVAAYRVGLHQLQRDDSPRFITIPESARPVVQIPLGKDLIHAPTGAVLLQLRWLGLEGRHDPVDELEQPLFAWK
jgi:8-oxo-dGTP pyrophosphatase MutT (NUDIX family)